MAPWNRRFLLETIMYRFHVKLEEGRLLEIESPDLQYPYSVITSSHQQDIMLALEMLEASSWTIQIPFFLSDMEVAEPRFALLFLGGSTLH